MEAFVELTPGVAAPPLDSTQVHVWHFSLAAPPAVLPGLRALLDAGECARADRFYRAIHGARFTAGRAILRQLLGAYTGEEPAALEFTYGETGKPALAPDGRVGGICFNLSHSGDTAVCAIARDLALGVDVEVHRANPDLLKIARRFFAPQEYRALLALPATDQEAAFYQCWTAKEALIKAWGLGLSAPLDAFTVHVAPGDSALLRQDVPEFAGDDWRVLALTVPPGRSASVAYSGAPRAVEAGVLADFPRGAS